MVRPRQESNLRSRLRRPVLYPLSYEGRTARTGVRLKAKLSRAPLGLSIVGKRTE